MLRFGILATILFLLLNTLFLGLLLSIPVGSSQLSVGLSVSWAALLNGLLELARVDMVLHRRMGAFDSLRDAISRLLKQPQLLLSATLLWATLGVLEVLYWWLTGAVFILVPARSVTTALLAHQAAILLGSWLVVLNLSLAVELSRHLGRRSSGEA